MAGQLMWRPWQHGRMARAGVQGPDPGPPATAIMAWDSGFRVRIPEIRDPIREFWMRDRPEFRMKQAGGIGEVILVEERHASGFSRKLRSAATWQ